MPPWGQKVPRGSVHARTAWVGRQYMARHTVQARQYRQYGICHALAWAAKAVLRALAAASRRGRRRGRGVREVGALREKRRGAACVGGGVCGTSGTDTTRGGQHRQ